MAENNKKVKVHASATARGATPDALRPLVDVYESPDGSQTVLVAEIPGAAPNSTDVRVDKGVLTIAADAGGTEHDEKYVRTYTGLARGEYFRAFALSDEIDRDKITASLSDGVLTVHLPRAEQAKTRKIEIKTE